MNYYFVRIFVERYTYVPIKRHFLLLSGKSPITVIVSCNRHRFSYTRAAGMIGPILATTLVTAPHGDILQDSFVVLSVDGTTVGHKTKPYITAALEIDQFTLFQIVPRCLELIERLIQIVCTELLFHYNITKYDILVMYIPIMFPNESDEAIPNDFCGWCTLIMTDDSAEYFSHF